MDGIEKIIGRIASDAEREAEQILNDARAQAEKISQEYQTRAHQQAQRILEQGNRQAAAAEERMVSAAKLEARKAQLAVKQELVEKAFQRALELLDELPEATYTELLACLAAQAAATGQEEVLLSPRDRERCGKQVVQRANQILNQEGAPKLPDEMADSKVGAWVEKVVAGAHAILKGNGMLSLSEKTRPIAGGVILKAGNMEANASFEVLLQLKRDEIAAEVAAILFPEEAR